jgi:hypothetical protein
MGERLRSRVLLYLGLGKVWVELEALSARMRRIEQDMGAGRPALPRPTIPAMPPPPPDTGVRPVAGSREELLRSLSSKYRRAEGGGDK